MRGLLLSLLLIHSSVSAATYFVTPGGTGTRAGTSWQNAGNGISWVNTKMRGGDTVYFGAGDYYNAPIIPPVNYNGNDRTCYADSALWAGNTSVIGGKARIWGGYNVKDSAWTVHSGAIYRTSKWNPSNCISGGLNTVVLVVDEQIYTSKSTLSGVTGPGQFYYNESTDVMYVWFIGNATPSTRTHIVPSCRGCALFTSDDADYTTFWGLRMYASAASTVHAKAGVDQDSMFIDHCVLKFIGNTTSNNTGAYYGEHIKYRSDCGGNPDCTYSSDRMWNRMRACSTMYVKWEDNTGYQGACVTTYSESHFTAESCYVAYAGGFLFKNKDLGGTSKGNTVKFSKLEKLSGSAFYTLCWQTQDSLYGNVIVGSGNDNNHLIGMEAVRPSKGGHWIANNTFYNFNKVFVAAHTAGSDPNEKNQPPNWFKYNVLLDTDGSSPAQMFVMPYNTEDYNWAVDSNCYYNVDTRSAFRLTGTTVAYATWKTRKQYDGKTHDSRSTYNTVNPSCVNPASGDFSRPAASQEMNITYGGRTWTRLGAWQPGGVVPPPPPPPPPPPVDTTEIICTSCVGPMTGNADGSADDIIDMADLMTMLDYALDLGPVKICLKEANCDGSADGLIDLTDVSWLIDYLQGRRTSLAPCQ